jgi:hypothetical protein
MIIYESVTSTPSLSELQEMAIPLVQQLYPSAHVLSSDSEVDSFHIVLKDKNVLTGVELYRQKLTSDMFEMLLRSACKLESKRKAQNDARLQDIALCLLAPEFASELVARVPSSMVRLRFYRWSLIRSQASQALLINEVLGGHKEMTPATNANPWPIGDVEIRDVPPLPSSPPPPPEPVKSNLSEPEALAFAEFGRELRRKRTQIKD